MVPFRDTRYRQPSKKGSAFSGGLQIRLFSKEAWVKRTQVGAGPEGDSLLFQSLSAPVVQVAQYTWDPTRFSRRYVQPNSQQVGQLFFLKDGGSNTSSVKAHHNSVENSRSAATVTNNNHGYFFRVTQDYFHRPRAATYIVSRIPQCILT